MAGVTPLGQAGRDPDEIMADLAAKRDHDVRWEDGRAFGAVYDGGPGVREIAERAASLFLHENALNTRAFPSLGQIQSETVSWTAGLLNGPDTTSGFLTSGGTESILCGVKAARERARAERGIDAPEIVLSSSAHAAFHKGAHLFGADRSQGTGPRRLDRRCRGHGQPGQREHGPRRWFGAPVSPGCDR